MTIALEVIFWVSFFLVGYTYLLYPVILLCLTLFSERKEAGERKGSDEAPTVTIVISVYNEEGVLRTKLENLNSLDYPREKLHFLFGSDGSTDRTVEILTSCGVENVRVLPFPERRGKARVLNDLFRLVNSEIVILSDANTLLESDAVSRLTLPFADPMVGAVCGSLILHSDNATTGGLGESVYWRYENVLKMLESRFRTTVGATGALYGIRTSLLSPLPTHKAVPDDLVIPARALMAGKSIAYRRDAIAHEDLSNSVTGEFQRKVRIGARDFQSISELAPLLHPRYGFVAFALWSRKIIRWFVPILLLMMVVASGVLSLESTGFLWLFLLQMAFYLMACIGYFLEKGGRRMGSLGLPYYFSAMNLALLIGFIRFLRGKQSFTWDIVR